jgi:hypothetical protein
MKDTEENKGNLNNEGNLKNENQEKNEKKKEYKIINLRKTNSNNQGQIYGRNFNSESGHKNEIEKLENEKYFLLSSGNYSENDPLVMRLDTKLKKLYESAYN